MKASRRRKLLAVARWLDRRSDAIKKFCADRTPKRPRKAA